MEVGKTQRGFDLVKFEDRNGIKCSLQKSSIADQDCLWLGVDDPEPKELVPGEGWRSYPIPEHVLLATRMHLTQAQVKELLPHLQHFAETGEIE